MLDVIVAVDTGGTFTDVAGWDGDHIEVVKVHSTPSDPSQAILSGLKKLMGRLGRLVCPLKRVVHGTTVATNAVLQRRGARVAFITNEGFGDLLLIGRQTRPRLFELAVKRRQPLVSPEDCFELEGRVDRTGQVVTELTDQALDDVVSRLNSEGPFGAVAVCLLHSYANPTHERHVEDAIRRAMIGASVSLSSHIHPHFREYERASTTVLNAYVQPQMAAYLQQLRQTLSESGFGDELVVLQSDGGAAKVDEVSRKPVHTLLSGPAGGVMGALATGEACRVDRLISFDMGGTSTDVSLLDGRPMLTRESTIDGLPLAVSTLDIHTVGAGGGSIAWSDVGGALKVGPQSAGAEPGPACYGTGEAATVTDANLVLGRLPADAFLGGEVVLDIERARLAIGRLASHLGSTVDETAQGIVNVANAHMMRAIKVISLERGYDPRDFSLVAFGGAGPLHACALSEQLDIAGVLVPASPGICSAVGMLGADFTRELTQSVMKRLDSGEEITESLLQPLLVALRKQATETFEKLSISDERRQVDVACDLRYVGQSFELTVSGREPFDDLVGRFHKQHETRFGYSMPERAVEWVSLKLRLRGVQPKPDLKPSFGSGVELKAGVGACAPCVPRSSLAVGWTGVGPLIVTEYSSTTWVPNGWTIHVLESGTLHLTRVK